MEVVAPLGLAGQLLPSEALSERGSSPTLPVPQALTHFGGFVRSKKRTGKFDKKKIYHLPKYHLK